MARFESMKKGFYTPETIIANAGIIAGILTLADHRIEKDLLADRSYSIEDHIIEAYNVLKEFASDEFVEVRRPEPKQEEGDQNG